MENSHCFLKSAIACSRVYGRTVYFRSPCNRFSRSSSGSTSPQTERSRVDSPVMIITERKRNAEFVSPMHDLLLAGMQHTCQYLDADASDRLLPDQRIV